LLQQVSVNTDAMMEAMSDIVWAINTRNDRFDNVVNRMRAFAIELFEPVGARVHLDVNQEINHLQLDMQQRKDLYLIFKEAVNNAAKYAGCKNVWISLEKHGKMCVLTIRDDGRGFNGLTTEDSLSGNGLRNMQKRAHELKGHLVVESTPGNGTAVKLTFNL
jgi:signal transduction histidine kinase